MRSAALLQSSSSALLLKFLSIWYKHFKANKLPLIFIEKVTFMDKQKCMNNKQYLMLLKYRFFHISSQDFTFIINCTAMGIPTPEIVWRLNWGHVPEKCKMTSTPMAGNRAFGKAGQPQPWVYLILPTIYMLSNNKLKQ